MVRISLLYWKVVLALARFLNEAKSCGQPIVLRIPQNNDFDEI